MKPWLMALIMFGYLMLSKKIPLSIKKFVGASFFILFDFQRPAIRERRKALFYLIEIEKCLNCLVCH